MIAAFEGTQSRLVPFICCMCFENPFNAPLTWSDNCLFQLQCQPTVAFRNDAIFVFETESLIRVLLEHHYGLFCFDCNTRRHATSGRHFALLKQLSSRIEIEQATMIKPMLIGCKQPTNTNQSPSLLNLSPSLHIRSQNYE